MKLLESLRWRYATKQFDPNKKLSDDQVNQLLDAGNLAATSFGLQPFKFIVINDPEIRQQLLASSWNQAQVVDASHLILIATRTDVNDDYITKYVELMESERGLPSGTLDGFKEMMTGFITPMDAHTLNTWASKQAYIALGTLLAACADAKIDACPMEGIVPKEYNEILGLTDMNLHATVALPVGYRSAEDQNQSAKKIRQSLSDMVVRI